MDRDAFIAARVKYEDAVAAIEQAAPGWPDVESVSDQGLLRDALSERSAAEKSMLEQLRS